MVKFSACRQSVKFKPSTSNATHTHTHTIHTYTPKLEFVAILLVLIKSTTANRNLQQLMAQSEEIMRCTHAQTV